MATFEIINAIGPLHAKFDKVNSFVEFFSSVTKTIADNATFLTAIFKIRLFFSLRMLYL